MLTGSPLIYGAALSVGIGATIGGAPALGVVSNRAEETIDRQSVAAPGSPVDERKSVRAAGARGYVPAAIVLNRRGRWVGALGLPGYRMHNFRLMGAREFTFTDVKWPRKWGERVVGVATLVTPSRTCRGYRFQFTDLNAPGLSPPTFQRVSGPGLEMSVGYSRWKVTRKAPRQQCG